MATWTVRARASKFAPTQVRTHLASDLGRVRPQQQRGRGGSRSVDTPFGRVYYDVEEAGSGVALACPDGSSEGTRRFSFGSNGMRWG